MTQEPQPRRNRPQPFWKAQTIRFLRTVIGLLEGAIASLEREPTPGEENLAWGDAILANVRSVLPESVNQRLSNLALTGILSSVVVVVAIGIVATLPPNPPEVAQNPPVTPPVQVIEPPPEPAPEPTLEPFPTPEPIPETPAPESVAEVPSPDNPELENPELTPEPIETPPELTVTEPPVPVEIAPPPPPILTPEQNLIATIQSQIAEVTQSYAGGVIDSLKADFLRSLLVIKVSEGWYALSPQRQDQLADQMFEQAQLLDFSKLEVMDVQGRLLARSPVVGSKMVILKRSSGSVSG